MAAIPGTGKLRDYYLYYAVLGELESRLEHHDKAAGYFQKALEWAELKSEKAFLQRKLVKIKKSDGGSNQARKKHLKGRIGCAGWQLSL